MWYVLVQLLFATFTQNKIIGVICLKVFLVSNNLISDKILNIFWIHMCYDKLLNRKYLGHKHDVFDGKIIQVSKFNIFTFFLQ